MKFVIIIALSLVAIAALIVAMMILEEDEEDVNGHSKRQADCHDQGRFRAD